jgi:hypothetical protein
MLDIEKMNTRAHHVLLTIGMLGVVVLAIGASLAGVVIAHEAARPRGDGWIAGIGPASGPIMMAAIGILIACLPWGILQVINILSKSAGDDRFRTEQLLNLLDGHRQVLESIRDSASLSDAAKQVTFRAKDLEALRRAIREDVEKGDFEAATMLVGEMERRFGYVQEADRLREEISQKGRADIDQRVNDTVEHVEVLLGRFEWDDATRESDRILRLFPSHPQARRLPARIQQARDDHKRELLKMWKDAIGKDDVDRSVELLRQLDQYLSPSEAEAYKESARDVFRKRLQQRGVQFALHVHDRNWTEALRIGRQIADEFPNTRMAAEVRERLPILTEKAQQPVGV